MKRVLAGIVALFVVIMIVVWVVAERADPEFLPQPAAFDDRVER